MYHVSTLLPFSPDNQQQVFFFFFVKPVLSSHFYLLRLFQLARKRHIGNDIVVVLFLEQEQEGEEGGGVSLFSPAIMSSEFNRMSLLFSLFVCLGVYNPIQSKHQKKNPKKTHTTDVFVVVRPLSSKQKTFFLSFSPTTTRDMVSC